MLKHFDILKKLRRKISGISFHIVEEVIVLLCF